MRLHLILVLLISALVMVGILAACSEASTSPTRSNAPANTPTPEPSLGLKLAVIDTGNPHQESDLRVARMNTLAERIAGKCGEPSIRVGDYAVKARELAREQGIDGKIADALEYADGLGGSPQGGCVGLFTLWLVSIGYK